MNIAIRIDAILCRFVVTNIVRLFLLRFLLNILSGSEFREIQFSNCRRNYWNNEHAAYSKDCCLIDDPPSCQ